MKKLTMINMLVAFLLLCGCAPHTSINATKSNIDNFTSRDARSNLDNFTSRNARSNIDNFTSRNARSNIDNFTSRNARSNLDNFTNRDARSNLDNFTNRDAKSNLDSIPGDCVTLHSSEESGESKYSNRTSVCIYPLSGEEDSARDTATSITECDTNDYSVNVLGKITNDWKTIIRSISASHWFFRKMGESEQLSNITTGSEQGEVERCIALFDGKVSTDFYFKVRNCQTLFDCSLEVVAHNNELAIGPFTSSNEILRRTNKRGVNINQSYMWGITVAATGKLYHTKIGKKHYLANIPNLSDKLIQKLSKLSN